MGRTDNINVPALTVVGAVSVLLVVAIIIFISAWFHLEYQAEVDVKQVLPPSQDLRRAALEQQALLSRYRWVDREAGVAAIPIERAMDLVVRESVARASAARASAPGNEDGP